MRQAHKTHVSLTHGFCEPISYKIFSSNDTLLTQAIRLVSSDFSLSYPPWTLFLKIILCCFHSQFIDPLPSPTVNNYHPTHPIVTTTPRDPSLSLIYSYFCIFSQGNVYWHNLCVISISMCKICDIQVDAWVVIDTCLRIWRYGCFLEEVMM